MHVHTTHNLCLWMKHGNICLLKGYRYPVELIEKREHGNMYCHFLVE